MAKPKHRSANASGQRGSQKLVGEAADIIHEDMQLVDMEELWLEGPAIVDENQEPEKRLIFLI